MSDDVEKVEREWTYAGLRRAWDGKEHHEWIDHDGTARHFDGFKGQFVGGVFRVTTTADGDTVFFNKKAKPEYVGPSDADDATKAGWRALHSSAEAAKRMEREAAKIDELDDLIKPLSMAYLRCKDKHQRAALIGVIIQKVTMGRV